MKLLKLIPAAAIVLTAFTTFEAKAGYPDGWTKKNRCARYSGYLYKLQKTDTPASYGVYGDQENVWIIENVSYDCATNWYKYRCGTKTNEPTCTS
tara:strand:- start:295 stop:579 length:285 start_codon:yes stop_codon:yes gene_type:complete